MRDNGEKLPVRTDAYVRVCLTAIAVLLAVLVVGLWGDHAPPAVAAPAARGPFLDSSTQTQLVELVRAQEKTTAKLDELLRLFKSGRVKVQLAESPVAPRKGKDAATKTK